MFNKMKEIFNAVLKSNSTVTVNGEKYNASNSVIVMSYNKTHNIIIDGKSITQEGVELVINITGECGDVSSTNGSITVNGNTQDVSSTNGDINVTGSTGNVQTVNGDVRARTINGKINSVNGDITV